MRISDWSSDVCSSDLSSLRRSRGEGDRARRAWWRGGDVASLPLRQRFALPPPHRFATGRIIMSASGPFSYSPFSVRSEEHTSELQSLMRISYAVFCLKKKKKKYDINKHIPTRY